MENNKTYEQLYKVIDDILFDFVTYRKYKNREDETKNFYELEKKYKDETYNNLLEEKEEYNNNIYNEFYNKEKKHDYKVNNYNDIDHMENILTELNKKIYTHIVYILDEHEYEGSPIYNNILDKEFIAQLVDKVIDRLLKDMKEVEEIINELVKSSLCRLRLLRSLIELCIMCELFSFRRPHYRKYNIINNI